MTWSLIFSLLGALPKVIALLQQLADYVAVREARGQGRAEAVAEALTIGAAQIEIAVKAEREAAAAHAAHPNDDTGFDPDFKRSD